MDVVLFGASGMIGKGVLLECLEHPGVSSVRVVGRSGTGLDHPKLTEIRHSDFLDFGPIEAQLTGLDACFWCLGVSAGGMSEPDYRRITYDFTMVASEVLLRLNPGLKMCFVSGAGTDSSGEGRAMWARVKGEAENALLEMPFASATMFRPAYIQPMKGVKSKTRSYRVMYFFIAPFYFALKRLPRYVTTTETIGQAMIKTALEGAPKPILESEDINALL